MEKIAVLSNQIIVGGPSPTDIIDIPMITKRLKALIPTILKGPFGCS